MPFVFIVLGLLSSLRILSSPDFGRPYGADVDLHDPGPYGPDQIVVGNAGGAASNIAELSRGTVIRSRSRSRRGIRSRRGRSEPSGKDVNVALALQRHG